VSWGRCEEEEEEEEEEEKEVGRALFVGTPSVTLALGAFTATTVLS